MPKIAVQRSVPRIIAVVAPWFLLAALLAACSPAAGRPARPAARPAVTPDAPSCPWLDQALPVRSRVALLLARMTVADKITMVGGQGKNGPYVFATAAQPALCIPAMGMEDGPNDVGDRLTGVTQLPAGVSLAATFDPPLARRYGTVIGAEERGKGASVNLGPTVNIDRDPRWGRSFEAFTEDPFLDAAMASSEIEGVQSQGVMSQVKHFAAYNQETNRNTPADDVIVSDRALHEIYLPAFEQAVTRARAASVMCAYSTVNGAYSCQNRYLLTQTLDRRWGFKGFVTSDDGAIHATSAALDGTDMEQPFRRYFGRPLERDVQHGTIPVPVLNGMVSRILTEMFRFRLFSRPPAGSATATVTTPAHQAVATTVAEDGTVLLKNSGGTLPLPAAKAGPIAVIGPAAAAAPADSGGGSSFVTPAFTVTPLQGLTAAARAGTRIVYRQGLPLDTRLPAIPAPALSPAYAATRPGGSYSGTLTAPQTGTYVLAMDNPCHCYRPANLYLDGREILSDPGTQPVSTYSAGVRLKAGHAYSIRITGESSSLTWATPSALAPGISRAVAAARSASAAVVVVSDDTETEASDRPDLRLPSAQDELISAVAAASPHTVVVIDAGAPVAMPWISQVAAVVDAWYPGESNGTALASVLYGRTDPSGHLPVTFPRELSQVPASTPAEFPGVDGKVDYSEGISVGYRWYDARGIRPLFPFGYGLSYTTFRFSRLQVKPADARNRHAGHGRAGHGRAGCRCNGHSIPLVRVSARVTNTGHVRGSDVAQLYLGDPASAGEPPRQLKGFRRVTLRPGRSSTVRFTLDGRDLSYWSDAANGWVVPDGRFIVRVGDSSALASLPLMRGFTVTGSISAS